jgi:hypothetical protein
MYLWQQEKMNNCRIIYITYVIKDCPYNYWQNSSNVVKGRYQDK